jgi:hypothetical protein
MTDTTLVRLEVTLTPLDDAMQPTGEPVAIIPGGAVLYYAYARQAVTGALGLVYDAVGATLRQAFEAQFADAIAAGQAPSAAAQAAAEAVFAGLDAA